VDSISAEEIVIEEGKSSELTAAFQSLLETTVNGMPKYGQKTCREVARVIACRTYAPPLLELCHLLVIASATDQVGGRYENFFWDSGPARASAFKGYLAGCASLPDDIRVQSSGIEISYGTGEFGVTFSRMPFLSALLEFLVTSVGYGNFDEAISPLLGKIPSQKNVSDAANTLSRIVYDYLKEHLPTVQTQRKSRSLLTFLAEQGNGEVGPSTLDDQAILGYWLSHSADEGNGIDAKTYQSVFLSAISLLRVLRFAVERYRMDGALPIGTDRDAGEIDPAKIEDAVESIDYISNPLERLKHPPADRIKFLNGREMETLDGFIYGAGTANDLPLSVLRNAVFGRAQSRITNSIRKNPTVDETLSFIETATDIDYESQIDRLYSLVEHLNGTMLASLHVLIHVGRIESASIIMSLLPGLDLKELAEGMSEPDWGDSNVVSLHAETTASRFIQVLQRGAESNAELQELLSQALKAYKGNSRQGFQEKDLDSNDVINGFVIAVDALMSSEKELKSFLNHSIENVDWSRQFKEDESIFKDQYRLLYGAENG
jgi:hypothetical protein